MVNIGIVGCGKWATILINEINKKSEFNLTSVVCRKKKIFSNKINVFSNVNEMLVYGDIDCLFVAANPKLNLEVIKLLNEKKLPTILEKPLANNYESAKDIQKWAVDNNVILYPNLPNYFSETFIKLKQILQKNYREITKIIIYEGGFGPFRENIHPIWDWGFHSISLLFLLFKNINFSNVRNFEIKANNDFGKGLVTKFEFKIDKNINVKILNGNLFNKKLRKIKIILKNNDCIENDMILHRIQHNKEIIFSNKETPINSLLNNFFIYFNNKDNTISRELIDASCKTTKFLEKFYKC